MDGRPLKLPHQVPGAASKIAIPRLERRDHDRRLPREDKPRVDKACSNCRKRKVKCTGELPHCQNCLQQNVACFYAQGRRDRLKEATDQNRQLIALLKDLSIRAEESQREKIERSLALIGDDDVPSQAPQSPETLGKRSRGDSESDDSHKHEQSYGEARVSGSTGSNDDLDLLDEDLLRSRESRATGFMGQNSEVQWLRSLKTKRGGGRPDEGSRGPPGQRKATDGERPEAPNARRQPPKLDILHVTDSTFYLDSDDLDLDVIVDPYELPPSAIAEKLFSCYRNSLHSSFPVIPKAFEEQFRKYYDSVTRQQPYQVPAKWQAILNLVFAIGARYSHLIQAEWQADERDHLIYMIRAMRLLGFNHTAIVFATPDLPLIQATGLFSLYYLTIGHVSRAWIMIGISIRFALAVGLHLRNDDPSAPPDKKEALVSLWWSLHSIESLLSVIVGRPCVLPSEDCTVPPPQALPSEHSLHNIVKKQRSTATKRSKRKFVPPALSSEGSSSSSPETLLPTSFLRARITIDLISGKALKSLYSPRTAIGSWENIQQIIRSLTTKLEEWAASALPDGLHPTQLSMKPSDFRERLLLAFHYNSTKVMISRPCLCRLERRIKDQSNASWNFNQKTAQVCVQAAQEMTRLFPDTPDPAFIYTNGPWWSIIHNIMQAMAVFMLELAFGEIHLTSSTKDIHGCIRKLIQWLRALKANNAVAGRAYKVVIDILRSDSALIRMDTAALVAEADLDEECPSWYPQSTVLADPTYVGHAFPQNNDWVSGMANVSEPTTTFEPSFPTATDQQPLVDFDGFNPDQDFLLDPGLQMPSTFGNPFLSNFDQPNPLNTAFSPSTVASLEDMWAIFPNSTTASQEQRENR